MEHTTIAVDLPRGRCLRFRPAPASARNASKFAVRSSHGIEVPVPCDVHAI
jgi:hypothetical protein